MVEGRPIGDLRRLRNPIAQSPMCSIQVRGKNDGVSGFFRFSIDIVS